jgi:glycosyltransferase involved in cell wall biosynthesis
MKIRESIQKSGIKFSDIQLPYITRSNFFEFESLKKIFLNIYPPFKPDSSKSTFTNMRMLQQTTFNISLNHLIRAFRSQRPEVIIAETSPAGWVTTLAAKKLGIPCIIDVHGLAFAEAKGWNQKDWRQTMNLEKEAFKNSDHLIVVSERMKEYISKEFKITNKKITIAPNGSDLQQSVAEFQKPLKVIYAGIFSYWEKIGDFIDIAKQANQETFRFYLAGAGPIKHQLIERIRKEKIPISYLGYVPRQRINKLLARMQIGIAPSTKDLARQVASPIKVFDYLASGLPVITPKIGDWGEIINNEDCGIALVDDNVESYLKALDILAQKNIWTEKSRNAISVIEKKFSWTKVLEPITNLLLTYEK